MMRGDRVRRALWHWLRYGTWTRCRHAEHRAQIVRRALHSPDQGQGVGEGWTVCVTCGVRLHRRPEALVEAAEEC